MIREKNQKLICKVKGTVPPSPFLAYFRGGQGRAGRWCRVTNPILPNHVSNRTITLQYLPFSLLTSKAARFLKGSDKHIYICPRNIILGPQFRQRGRKEGRKEVKNKDDALRPLGRRDVVVGLNGVCFGLENGL